MNYNFSFAGNHSIFILIDLSNCKSLSYMFYKMKNIISIYFSSLFKIENITDMNHIFSECISLTSVDISNLDTKRVIVCFLIAQV
jgi:surface protein